MLAGERTTSLMMREDPMEVSGAKSSQARYLPASLCLPRYWLSNSRPEIVALFLALGDRLFAGPRSFEIWDDRMTGPGVRQAFCKLFRFLESFGFVHHGHARRR